MGLRIVEDRPTPKEVYNWRVYAMAFSAAFGAVIFGYDSGFIGGTLALPSFTSVFLPGGTSLHPTETANIVSFYQVGAIVGALTAYPLAERYGRKASMLYAGLTNILGAALQLGATDTLGIFYAGRIIGGIGVGAVSMCVPVYISEISPTSIRGRLVGLYELLLQCGGLVGFWIPYGVNANIPSTSATQWRIPVGLQLVPAGILCILVPFIRESPRWLLKRGERERAISNLCFIRNLPADHTYVIEEIALIDDAIQLETGTVHSRGRFSMFKEVSLKGNRNRLAIGMCLMMFQNLTGINAINYYSPTIFASLGVTGTSAGLFSTGIYGVVKTVCTLLFCFVCVDLVGRRKIFIVGAAGGAFAMYYLAGYIAIAKPAAGKDLGSGGISAIAMIFVFAVFYSFSWNGLPWVYCSEIFPLSIRSFCAAITSATQWTFQFAIARSTPYMLASLGYGTYIFFGSWMIVMIGFTLLFVKETKGVTLEQMDVLWGLAPSYRSGAESPTEKHSTKENENMDDVKRHEIV